MWKSRLAFQSGSSCWTTLTVQRWERNRKRRRPFHDAGSNITRNIANNNGQDEKKMCFLLKEVISATDEQSLHTFFDGLHRAIFTNSFWILGIIKERTQIRAVWPAQRYGVITVSCLFSLPENLNDLFFSSLSIKWTEQPNFWESAEKQSKGVYLTNNVKQWGVRAGRSGGVLWRCGVLWRWQWEFSAGPETLENLNLKRKCVIWAPISDKKAQWQKKTLGASSDGIHLESNLRWIIFTIRDRTIWHRSVGETRAILPEDDELMGNRCVSLLQREPGTTPTYTHTQTHT